MLKAKETSDGWCVVDSEGGVWWPDEDADLRIRLDERSEDMAVSICENMPYLGRWHS